jgi:3-dehydroquinate dehydratase/shikimate dehydrogenase
MDRVTLVAVSIHVAAGGDPEAAIAQAREAVAEGARLVEWRIDELAAEPTTAAELVARSPAPAIATCRGRAEGGAFAGAPEERAALYEALAAAERPPRYVDVEFGAWQGSEALRRRLAEALARGRRADLHTSLILSLHDFQGRPADLLRRIEAMTAEPACDVIKVAWQARSLRDNLEAFDLLHERRKPTIALCMGESGLMSRVLAPKFGALLVYASGRAGAETAPGQPTVGRLKTLGFDRVGPRTAVYGVIGWPVGHSLSPAVHNAGFESAGHDGVYLPLPVPPEYEHFKATVGSFLDHPRLDFRGASVTAPHKEHLLRFVTERGGAVDPAAGRIGAANTLWVDGQGSPCCANTDAPALVQALAGAGGPAPRNLAGARVAVLGAGGMARAAVAALGDAGATVVVFNRTQARAEALAAEFNGRPGRVGAGRPGAAGCGCFDAIVNCTVVGMQGGPAAGRSPLPEGVPLDGRVTVLDTVYAPRRTSLLRQAELAGARTVGGIEVFLHQAARQFERWTGKAAPRDVFRQAIEQA